LTQSDFASSFIACYGSAAASNREEFNEIVVAPEDLQLLGDEILGLAESPMNLYPVQLTQLSTKGVIHNQSPIPDVKYLPHPYVSNGTPIAVPTFRFYMDGLIAHIHRATPLGYGVAALGNLLLGGSGSVVLSTVAFDDSAQAVDIAEALGGLGNEGMPSTGFGALPFA
jgi:hypothetical protein